MVVDSRNSDSRRRGRSHHVTYICNGGSLSCCLFVSALCLVFSSVASGFKQMGVNERGSVRTAKFMDCEALSVPLCGVLTLETGYGGGNYHHPGEPTVHGLWPQTPPYGSSQCIRPSSGNPSDPTRVYSCYADNNGHDSNDIVSFESHEWEKHGECAGVEDAKDFFTQVCKLAEEPLQIMKKGVQELKKLEDLASDLSAAGFEVYDVDPGHSQLELSVCASQDGQWKVAALADMKQQCGSTNDKIKKSQL